MFKKWVLGMIVCCLCVSFVGAQERITYVTQPDEVTVFLNGVAYVRDALSIPNTGDVQIALPANMFEDTLIVREGATEVDRYTLKSVDGVLTLQIPTVSEGAMRDLTLEYLAVGITWQPVYRMTLNPEDEENVQFSYYASVVNDQFTLDEAVVRLAAGSVDVYASIPTPTDGYSMNQAMTIEDTSVTINSLATGSVTIQYTYDIGTLSTEIGDTLYTKILDEVLPARRILLWNAQGDASVSVIYKVRNTTDLPLTEGIVRTYQAGLLVGSDMIEFTPIGSEGSVTVGTVQSARVKRQESTTSINAPLFSDLTTQHDVTLTLTNFSQSDVTIEVVDVYPINAQEFTYSQEPASEGDNVLRWIVSIPMGETITLTYQFKAPY